MNKAYTREEFETLRLAGKQEVRRDSRLAAVISVILGLLALWFLNRICDTFPDTERIAVSIFIFTFYAAAVVWLLWRMKRTEKKTAILCPQCNKPLDGDSCRIASATGKCEKCGGLVITE